MNDEHFEQWQELECEVGSHIGLDIQIDTESRLALDWISQAYHEATYATYNLKWTLIRHFQEHGLKALLNDYQEIEPLTEFNIRR